MEFQEYFLDRQQSENPIDTKFVLSRPQYRLVAETIQAETEVHMNNEQAP